MPPYLPGYVAPPPPWVHASHARYTPPMHGTRLPHTVQDASLIRCRTPPSHGAGRFPLMVQDASSMWCRTPPQCGAGRLPTRCRTPPYSVQDASSHWCRTPPYVQDASHWCRTPPCTPWWVCSSPYTTVGILLPTTLGIPRSPTRQCTDVCSADSGGLAGPWALA